MFCECCWIETVLLETELGSAYRKKLSSTYLQMRRFDFVCEYKKFDICTAMMRQCSIHTQFPVEMNKGIDEVNIYDKTQADDVWCAIEFN